MKRSLFILIFYCLLFGLVIPKLHITLQNEMSDNKVVNSVKLPDKSTEMLDYLKREQLNNIKVLVFSDSFILDKANSSVLAGLMKNGYKVGVVTDLSYKSDDYFGKLSDALAEYSVHIIYFQDRITQFDYGTFMKISLLSKENGIAIGLLENEMQNGLQIPELQKYSAEISGNANRGLLTEIKDISGLSNTEISLRLLRSVVDRGIRLNLLAADNLEALRRYNSILEELNRELTFKGYEVSSEVSPVNTPGRSFYNFFIVVAFVTATMLSLKEAAGLKRKTVVLVILVFLIVTLVLYFTNYSISMIFLSLIITILVPCLVTISLYKYVVSSSRRYSLINILKLNVASFLIYVVSGLFVWLALSDYVFRMGFVTYKLAVISYIVPVLIILIYMLLKDGNNLKRIKKALCKRKSVAIMLLFAAVTAVYLSRSGNFSLFPATPAELYFRMFLEKIMPVRPRLKEFFIGYPAFFLLFAVNNRKDKTVVNILTLFSAIAGISILNTFCHSIAAVNVSVTRALLGFMLGTFTGILSLYIFKTYFSDRTL